MGKPKSNKFDMLSSIHIFVFFHLPSRGNLPRYVFYHAQLLAYQDCIYRNMNSYQYLALQDIDELLVPLQAATVPEFIAQVNKANYDILIGSIELRKVNCNANKDDGNRPYFTAQCGANIDGPHIGESSLKT